MIIGECLHQVRFALDHTASQLVLAAEGTPTNLTAFPIHEDRIVHNGKRHNIRKITVAGGVDQLALILMKRAQPYQSFEGHTMRPLWILHELSNIDKHREPLLVAGAHLRDQPSSDCHQPLHTGPRVMHTSS
jgi:hypothetical protein